MDDEPLGVSGCMALMLFAGGHRVRRHLVGLVARGSYVLLVVSVRKMDA